MLICWSPHTLAMVGAVDSWISGRQSNKGGDQKLNPCGTQIVPKAQARSGSCAGCRERITLAKDGRAPTPAISHLLPKAPITDVAAAAPSGLGAAQNTDGKTRERTHEAWGGKIEGTLVAPARVLHTRTIPGFSRETSD